MVQPHPVAANGLQHCKRAQHVAVQERCGVGQRVVDVRLRGEVRDDVGIRDQSRHHTRVGDVALNHTDGVVEPGQRFAAAGIRERIEHCHRHIGTLTQRAADEVGADEPGTARHQ